MRRVMNGLVKRKAEENDIYFPCKQLFARSRTNFQDFAKFRLHISCVLINANRK